MHNHSVYRKFCENARRHPQRLCLRSGEARLTYGEVHAHAGRLAAFLQHQYRVSAGEAVIVVAAQSSWWLIVSLALQAIGAVEFAVDATKSQTELDALAASTSCTVIIFLDAAAADRLLPRINSYVRVVLGPGVDMPVDGPRADHLLAVLEGLPAARTAFNEQFFPVSAVIATSGTTGEAKPVPVSHQSFLHAMRVVPRVLNLRKNDVFLSCLPSWHLYARLVEYVALATGGSIVYSSIEDLPQTLRDSGATVFPSFPEIWEKIYRQILFSIEQSKLKIFLRHAISLVIATDRIFEYWFSRARYEKKASAFLAIGKLAYLLPVRWVLQRTVFYLMRRRVSPSLRYAIMGDAPLPLIVDETLRAIGFEVLEGYGSTEQCVTALRRPARNFPGAVGRVLPGVHVTIDHTTKAEWNGASLGEIVVSGPNVFTGYFEDLRSLRQSKDPQQPFATGDIGSLDAKGNLLVVGRKVNAFHLKTGETIFPELVENVLRGSRFVERVLVFGENEATPVALVVPDFHELLQWLVKHTDIPAVGGYADTPEHHKSFWQPLLDGVVKQLYAHEFAALLAESGLPLYARPVAFHLLAWRFHRGAELTLTLKPRRGFIREQLEGVIFAKRE